MKLIQLTQGQFAMVDDEDFEELNQFKWYASWDRNCFYTVRGVRINGKKKALLMHRVVMNAQDSDIIDHIDGVTLNNQKSNLRFCTSSQNSMNRKVNSNNSTGHKGISPNGKGYKAQIYLNGKQIYLGIRSTAEEAHQLYKEASKKYHGDFGRVA